MRILVTGGAGFIGSHVVDAYVNEGHEVFVIDNLSTGNKTNLNPKAKFYEADIKKDLAFIIKEIKPQIINHHAAQIDIRTSIENPLEDAAVNIIGTINLIHAGLKNGIKKFIFASSGGAIYGEQDYFPADEMHPAKPFTPYAISKFTCEKYLNYYKSFSGLDYVSLRYSNVYGPRQNPFGEAGVVAIFSHKLIKGEQPIINGSGDQTRDYVYVSDVAEANVKALNTDFSGEINISTGIEASVMELFNMLRNINKSDILALNAPAKKGDQLRSCLSYKKAESIFNWTPVVNFDKGLIKTHEWFLGNIR